jgi:hypothetical protein
MLQKVMNETLVNRSSLFRFKTADNPQESIAAYLWFIADEADKRNFKFNRGKIVKNCDCRQIKVTEGQLEYEFRHLLSKLKVRDPKRYEELKAIKKIKYHPLFRKVDGDIEDWEVIHKRTT